MSKVARLNLLRNNLAKKTDNFQEIDKQYAFGVWTVEKEFHVGPLTSDFLLMKFWNILDKDNIEQYNKINERAQKQSNKPVAWR